MKQQLNSLTGLRGFAAFIVFVSHAANQGMLPSIFGNGFGQLGVMVFFVLSGFLMGHLYLPRQFTQENVIAFAVSRVGRVFPLYFLLVFGAFVVVTQISSDFHYRITDLATLSLAVLFVKAPQEFWTIPVEVQFYVFFVLAWGCFRSRFRVAYLLLLFVIATAPAVAVIAYWGKAVAFFPTFSLAFFIGIGYSLVYPSARKSHAVKKVADCSGVLFLLLFLVNLPEIRLQHGFVISESFLVRTWLDPLNWIIVCGLFFSALMESRSLGFLHWVFFQRLGVISYGFYLLHYPVLELVGKTNVLYSCQAVLAFVVICVISQLLFVFFEDPVNRQIKALFLPKQKIAS